MLTYSATRVNAVTKIKLQKSKGMQEKEFIMDFSRGQKNLSFKITVQHH